MIGTMHMGYEIIAAMPAQSRGHHVVTGGRMNSTMDMEYMTWVTWIQPTDNDPSQTERIYHAGHHISGPDARARAFEHMVNRAGLPTRVSAYAVAVPSMPTFYLVTSVQGITDRYHATRLAEVITDNPLTSVERVDLRADDSSYVH